MAWTRTRSRPSLVAGLACGSLYAAATVMLMMQSASDDTAKQGRAHFLAAGTGAMLAGGTLPRALRTRKHMPLLLGSLALGSMAFHLRQFYQLGRQPGSE